MLKSNWRLEISFELKGENIQPPDDEKKELEYTVLECTCRTQGTRRNALAVIAEETRKKSTANNDQKMLITTFLKLWEPLENVDPSNDYTYEKQR